MNPFQHLPQIGAGHAALKDFVAFRDNLHGNPERLMPIEGLWANSVAIKLGLEIRTAFICPELLRSPEYEKAAAEVVQKAERSFVLSQKTFEKISDRDGPSGVASIVKPTNIFEGDLSALKSNKKIKRYVLMDAAEVPGNIGTLLRALDGLGESALILTNKRVRLTHPKVVKGSLGAIFTVPIFTTEVHTALKFFADEKISIYAADSSEKAKVIEFSKAQVPEHFALILGSEKYGISDEIYAAKPIGIQIPMKGVCDSLNVSIAGAIMLYGLVYRQTN
jgi:TrmH family RNA methyltransferase